MPPMGSKYWVIAIHQADDSKREELVFHRGFGRSRSFPGRSRHFFMQETNAFSHNAGVNPKEESDSHVEHARQPRLLEGDQERYDAEHRQRQIFLDSNPRDETFHWIELQLFPQF